MMMFLRDGMYRIGTVFVIFTWSEREFSNIVISMKALFTNKPTFEISVPIMAVVFTFL